jgi:hypothetical protein
VVNTTGNVTNREMNYDSRNDISNEWKLVSANKDRVNRKSPLHQSQPIPTIIKRYAVLGNLQNKFQSPQRHEHVNMGKARISNALSNQEKRKSS